MKEGTRNFFVGVFVIASLSTLAILMVWFGEAPSWLGGSEWTLKIKGVRELSGVGEGSPVRLSGVEIGRVQQLDFQDPERPDLGVVIVCGIKNEYSIPNGSTARIYGATLGIGTGHIAIMTDPTVPFELLPQGTTISGEMRSMIGELISQETIDELKRAISHIGNLTAEWTPVGTNLAKLLEQRPVEAVEEPGAADRGLTPNLSTVIDRIDQLVANINTVLGDKDVQGDVKAVVQDLKVTSTELRDLVVLWTDETKKLADNLNQGVDRTEANLEDLLLRLTNTADSMDEAANRLATILDHVAKGQGTAGLLVRDERLYEAAVLSLERFSASMGSLQRILGKIEEDGYITVGQAPTGLLRKRYPVPAQAAEMP